MAEYIEREDVREMMRMEFDDNYADEAVDRLPPADVAPVRHGRWEEIRDAYGKLEGWLCKCGREVKSKDNYCPNCGAKMDGGDDDAAD